jgi:hypothetical protein
MYLAGRSCRWCVALDRWRVLSGGQVRASAAGSGLDDERTASRAG